MCADITLRTARDADGPEIAQLIADVFAEYPGCVMDLEGECPDLLFPDSHYRAKGGRFWVALGDKTGDEILATCAVEATPRPGVFAIERLYVKKSARGQGLASRLCAKVEIFVRAQGGHMIDCWTDTRFADAHRLYARLGYERQPEMRDLNDLSNSTEFHFIKQL
jgi:putative acetyltransferase